MHELLKAGQSVIATSRKPEALQAELKGTYDVETVNRALVVGLDVSKVEEVKAIFDKAIDKFGRIDVVVNNAGYVSLIVNHVKKNWISISFKSSLAGCSWRSGSLSSRSRAPTI